MSLNGERQDESTTPLSYEPVGITPADASPAELLVAAFVGFITMVAVGGVTYAMLANKTSQSGMIYSSTLAPIAALCVTLLLLRALSPRSFEWIGLSIAKLKQSGKPAIVSIAICLPATFLAMVFFTYLYKTLNLHTETEHPLLRALKESPQLLPVVAISAVLLAPALEELIFRGCVQGAISRMLKHAPTLARWVSIGVTSAIFVFVHGEFWMMPPLCVLSVGLGFFYSRSQNLWVPMLTHAAFNAVSLTLFLSGQS